MPNPTEPKSNWWRGALAVATFVLSALAFLQTCAAQHREAEEGAPLLWSRIVGALAMTPLLQVLCALAMAVSAWAFYRWCRVRAASTERQRADNAAREREQSLLGAWPWSRLAAELAVYPSTAPRDQSSEVYFDGGEGTAWVHLVAFNSAPLPFRGKVSSVGLAASRGFEPTPWHRLAVGHVPPIQVGAGSHDRVMFELRLTPDMRTLFAHLDRAHGVDVRAMERNNLALRVLVELSLEGPTVEAKTTVQTVVWFRVRTPLEPRLVRDPPA